MKNAYNLSSPINAKSLNLLAKNLRSNYTLFKQYFNYNTVLTEKKLPENNSFEL